VDFSRASLVRPHTEEAGFSAFLAETEKDYASRSDESAKTYQRDKACPTKNTPLNA